MKDLQRFVADVVDDFDGDAVGAVVLIGFYEVILGVGKKYSPRVAQDFADANGVENGGAGFPIGVFDFAVFLAEGVAGVGGAFDELAGGLFVVLGNFHPHILERVGNLAENPVDSFKSLGEDAVHFVFHRIAVAQVGDPYFRADLTDTLDPALALFEARGVPWKVDVDECAEALEVEALGGGIYPEEQG
jgi:hypothetical protein